MSNSSLSLQKVTTKVKVYDDIFLTDSGFIPLPKNATELTGKLTIKSEQFQSPIRLAADLQGNYISVEGRYNHGLQDMASDFSMLRKMRVFSLLVGFSF
jgi:hypothetical protein